MFCPGQHETHFEPSEDAKPLCARPHPALEKNEVALNAELERPAQTGALSHAGPSEWSLPTFAAPKDGRVQRESDFCALNEVIECKARASLCIQDTLNERSGWKFCAKLDVSAQRQLHLSSGRHSRNRLVGMLARTNAALNQRGEKH